GCAPPGASGAQDSHTEPTSQCLLRAAAGHTPAGMPRLSDPADRKPPAPASQRVGSALQYRSPTRGLRARPPATAPTIAGAAASPPAPPSNASACGGPLNPGRLAP